MKPLFLKRLQM